jgi:hypothetical protein
MSTVKGDFFKKEFLQKGFISFFLSLRFGSGVGKPEVE